MINIFESHVNKKFGGNIKKDHYHSEIIQFL